MTAEQYQQTPSPKRHQRRHSTRKLPVIQPVHRNPNTARIQKKSRKANLRRRRA